MQMKDKGQDYIYFPASTIQEIKDEIIMSLLEMNGLVKANIHTGLVQFIDFFEGESTIYQLHSKSVLYQDKVFFLPWNAKRIAIYDTTNKSLQYIDTNNDEKPGRYIDYLRDGRYVYLLSDREWQIECLDMETEKIITSYQLIDDYKHIGNILIANNGYTYGLITNTNQIWTFDIYSKQYVKSGKLFNQKIVLIAGCMGDNCIWMVSDSCVIYQMLLDGNCLKQYDMASILDSLFKSVNIGAISCYFRRSKLTIILYDKNCTIEIPVINNTLTIEKYNYRIFNKSLFFIDEKGLEVMTENKLIFYEDTLEKELVLESESDFFINYMEKSNYKLNEQNTNSTRLYNLIEFVCENEKYSLCKENLQNGNIGKRILNMCK